MESPLAEKSSEQVATSRSTGSTLQNGKGNQGNGDGKPGKFEHGKVRNGKGKGRDGKVRNGKGKGKDGKGIDERNSPRA